mmetsp:Transcript_32794/g.103808  ORF Transcript_32794/g.103808 Transcript_32794/m.103808 type:complete len:284 (+) Transcript_32794:1789-2640(+)
MPALRLVPQPEMSRLWMGTRRSLARSMPPSMTRSPKRRPPKASARAMACGCSRHSRMVQCGKGAGESKISLSGAFSTRLRSRPVPLACTTPISPSCSAMKFFVYLANAAVSDAMYVRPVPRPMASGEPLQATTISSGLSREITAMPQVPSQRCSARAVASRRSLQSGLSSITPMSFASTSVSVSLLKCTPAAMSSARSSPALLMVPLCTSAMRSLASMCGCALASVLPPCVAQRVCAMPTKWPSLASLFCRSRSMESALVPRDAYLCTTRSASALSVAMPALS